MVLRYVVLAALAAGMAGAQQKLAIVRPLLNQIEGDAGVSAGHRFIAGETIFFSCLVSGYAASQEKKVDLATRVQAVDAKGVPLDEPAVKEINTELAPEDKAWMPKVTSTLVVPLLINPGTYRFLVTVDDKIGGGSAKAEVPFQVGGRMVEPSETLTVRNFRFLKGEDDTIPVKEAIYHPGEALWARFEITGFRYGPKNHVKVSYGVKVINATGKEIYSVPTAATEDSESFYPKHYLPGTVSLNFDADVERTGYTIVVDVRDEIGNQTYEEKQGFKIE